MSNHARVVRSLDDRIYELEQENRALKKLLGRDACFDPRLGLTATQTQLLGHILQRAPNVVSKDRLHEAIYFDRVNEIDAKIIDVMVCKIRARLRQFDIEIKTAWGQGFHIDAENAARLRTFQLDGEAHPA
jgi:DNA-binding response OmpR family regulator